MEEIKDKIGGNVVGNFFVGHKKGVPNEEIMLIENIVKNAQKARCKACVPCQMGVVGCDEDRNPHGHGCAQRCPECGVPYPYVHPHSNVCSKGTPIREDVRHDDHNLSRQLKWIKELKLLER